MDYLDRIIQNIKQAYDNVRNVFKSEEELPQNKDNSEEKIQDDYKSIEDSEVFFKTDDLKKPLQTQEEMNSDKMARQKMESDLLSTKSNSEQEMPGDSSIYFGEGPNILPTGKTKNNATSFVNLNYSDKPTRDGQDVDLNYSKTESGKDSHSDIKLSFLNDVEQKEQSELNKNFNIDHTTTNVKRNEFTEEELNNIKMPLLQIKEETFNTLYSLIDNNPESIKQIMSCQDQKKVLDEFANRLIKANFNKESQKIQEELKALAVKKVELKIEEINQRKSDKQELDEIKNKMLEQQQQTNKRRPNTPRPSEKPRSSKKTGQSGPSM